MKKMQKSIMVALVALFTLSASAQQVNTLYFLENAPMRHTINPAFQPVSKGYFSFSPLGWMSFGVGNNSFTMSDLLFVDPATGKTITPFHPNADKLAFFNKVQEMTLINTDMNIGLLNFGGRIKDNGYFTIGINERVVGGPTIPKSMFNFFFNGGMTNMTGVNNIALGGLGAGVSVYSEISGGYSHRINDKWSVGGKVKLLLGHAYAGMNMNGLNIDASTEQWRLSGDITMDVAAPINMPYFNQLVNGKNMAQIVETFQNGSFSKDSIFPATNNVAYALRAMTPVGFGAAFDLGLTYKPIENLQITAAITDLGFIYWTGGSRYSCTIDTTFTGAGNIDYSDPAYRDAQGNFSTQILMDTVAARLKGLLNGMQMAGGPQGAARMTSARLNIGVDANFWDNRVGVGILSATRLYNARLYEEVTFGAAFRPVNWFNIAVTYSLMNNGKYSNIGAGLSFMPYDGINLTLAMDYIPTSYTNMPNKPNMYVIPDKAKMINIAMGFTVCWGSNRKDKDHDGIWDRLDMCPDTPRGVVVDSVGCPLDIDHDGVPDYLDRCVNTVPEAVDFVDEYGCDKDSDGDGVPDYIDKCPDTPREAWGKVDSVGCPLDTDGDGVYDYMDKCPKTPAEAKKSVDKYGCPLDTDGDGVPDYLDKCPDTPVDAWGMLDENGCEKDSDGDGVPDYMDECPNTPKAAIEFVDARGCNIDTDADGVPDYKDACPTEPGFKEFDGCPEPLFLEEEDEDIIIVEEVVEEKK